MSVDKNRKKVKKYNPITKKYEEVYVDEVGKKPPIESKKINITAQSSSQGYGSWIDSNKNVHIYNGTTGTYRVAPYSGELKSQIEKWQPQQQPTQGDSYKSPWDNARDNALGNLYDAETIAGDGADLKNPYESQLYNLAKNAMSDPNKVGSVGEDLPNLTDFGKAKFYSLINNQAELQSSGVPKTWIDSKINELRRDNAAAGALSQTEKNEKLLSAYLKNTERKLLLGELSASDASAARNKYIEQMNLYNGIQKSKARERGLAPTYYQTNKDIAPEYEYDAGMFDDGNFVGSLNLLGKVTEPFNIFGRGVGGILGGAIGKMTNGEVSQGIADEYAQKLRDEFGVDTDGMQFWGGVEGVVGEYIDRALAKEYGLTLEQVKDDVNREQTRIDRIATILFPIVGDKETANYLANSHVNGLAGRLGMVQDLGDLGEYDRMLNTGEQNKFDAGVGDVIASRLLSGTGVQNLDIQNMSEAEDIDASKRKEALMQTGMPEFLATTLSHATGIGQFATNIAPGFLTLGGAAKLSLKVGMSGMKAVNLLDNFAAGTVKLREALEPTVAASLTRLEAIRGAISTSGDLGVAKAASKIDYDGGLDAALESLDGVSPETAKKVWEIIDAGDETALSSYKASKTTAEGMGTLDLAAKASTATKSMLEKAPETGQAINHMVKSLNEMDGDVLSKTATELRKVFGITTNDAIDSRVAKKALDQAHVITAPADMVQRRTASVAKRFQGADSSALVKAQEVLSTTEPKMNPVFLDDDTLAKYIADAAGESGTPTNIIRDFGTKRTGHFRREALEIAGRLSEGQVDNKLAEGLLKYSKSHPEITDGDELFRAFASDNQKYISKAFGQIDEARLASAASTVAKEFNGRVLLDVNEKISSIKTIVRDRTLATQLDYIVQSARSATGYQAKIISKQLDEAVEKLSDIATSVVNGDVIDEKVLQDAKESLKKAVLTSKSAPRSGTADMLSKLGLNAKTIDSTAEGIVKKVARATDGNAERVKNSFMAKIDEKVRLTDEAVANNVQSSLATIAQKRADAIQNNMQLLLGEDLTARNSILLKRLGLATEQLAAATTKVNQVKATTFDNIIARISEAYPNIDVNDHIEAMTDAAESIIKKTRDPRSPYVKEIMQRFSEGKPINDLLGNESLSAAGKASGGLTQDNKAYQEALSDIFDIASNRYKSVGGDVIVRDVGLRDNLYRSLQSIAVSSGARNLNRMIKANKWLPYGDMIDADGGEYGVLNATTLKWAGQFREPRLRNIASEKAELLKDISGKNYMSLGYNKKYGIGAIKSGIENAAKRQKFTESYAARISKYYQIAKDSSIVDGFDVSKLIDDAFDLDDYMYKLSTDSKFFDDAGQVIPDMYDEYIEKIYEGYRKNAYTQGVVKLSKEGAEKVLDDLNSIGLSVVPKGMSRADAIKFIQDEGERLGTAMTHNNIAQMVEQTITGNLGNNLTRGAGTQLYIPTEAPIGGKAGKRAKAILGLTRGSVRSPVVPEDIELSERMPFWMRKAGTTSETIGEVGVPSSEARAMNITPADTIRAHQQNIGVTQLEPESKIFQSLRPWQKRLPESYNIEDAARAQGLDPNEIDMNNLIVNKQGKLELLSEQAPDVDMQNPFVSRLFEIDPQLAMVSKFADEQTKFAAQQFYRGATSMQRGGELSKILDLQSDVPMYARIINGAIKPVTVSEDSRVGVKPFEYVTREGSAATPELNFADDAGGIVSRQGAGASMRSLGGSVLDAGSSMELMPRYARGSVLANDSLSTLDKYLGMSPDGMSGAQRLFREYYAPAITVLRGRFHLNNYLGGKENIARSGLAASKELGTAQRLKDVRRMIDDPVSVMYGLGDKMGDIPSRALDYGAISTKSTMGGTDATLGAVQRFTGSGNSARTRAWDYITDKASNLGSTIETNQRLDMFSRAKQAGLSDADATRLTNEFLYDYSVGNLKPFERTLRANVAPFYTFWKRNLELQGKQALGNPLTTGALASLYANNIMRLGDKDSPLSMMSEEERLNPTPSVSFENADKTGLKEMTFQSPLMDAVGYANAIAGAGQAVLSGDPEEAPGFLKLLGKKALELAGPELTIPASVLAERDAIADLSANTAGAKEPKKGGVVSSLANLAPFLGGALQRSAAYADSNNEMADSIADYLRGYDNKTVGYGGRVVGDSLPNAIGKLLDISSGALALPNFKDRSYKEAEFRQASNIKRDVDALRSEFNRNRPADSQFDLAATEQELFDDIMKGGFQKSLEEGLASGGPFKPMRTQTAKDTLARLKEYGLPYMFVDPERRNTALNQSNFGELKELEPNDLANIRMRNTIMPQLLGNELVSGIVPTYLEELKASKNAEKKPGDEPYTDQMALLDLMSGSGSKNAFMDLIEQAIVQSGSYSGFDQNLLDTWTDIKDERSSYNSGGDLQYRLWYNRATNRSVMVPKGKRLKDYGIDEDERYNGKKVWYRKEVRR